MGDIDARKRELRQAVLSVRKRLTPDDVASAAGALADVALRLPALAGAGTVAAYVSVGREPGTRPLLDALRSRGVQVLLPVLLPDNDLDWAEYTGPDSLVPAGRGLLEPAGPRLGPRAVADAEVVLLPGLAVDGGGMRLGRGGGSYDRVLARLEHRTGPGRPSLVVLLYEGELVEAVPCEPHDRRVDAAVLPTGVREFTGPSAPA